MKHYRVVVTPYAKESLRTIIEYIEKDSSIAANKVRKKLIETIRSLNQFPERFSKEQYLSNKPGNYRSVTLWHYKIVYKVLDDEVVILGIIHTSRDPELFKKI